jgi:hypothetical protein
MPCPICQRTDGSHDRADHDAHKAAYGVRCKECGRWADGELFFFHDRLIGVCERCRLAAKKDAGL